MAQDVILNYKTLYENSPCGYFCSTLDGTIIECNKRFIAFTGYQEHEILKKKRIIDFLTIGGQIYLETHFLPLLSFQGKVEEINFDFVKKDGTKFPVLINSIRIKNEKSETEFIQSTVFNISQRKSYEKELLISNKTLKFNAELIVKQKTELENLNKSLKHKNEQLKIANEELETFSYSVSHDLRAPLRGIDGFASILKEEYYHNLDEFGKTSIDTIVESAKKMNQLIDDILEYSGAVKKPIKYINFSIQQAIGEFLPDLKYIYKNVSVIIEEQIPDIYGDRKFVVLLLKNLVENAMKYSSKVKKPLVTIGYQDNQTYYIKDNGIGIDMKHHDKIFGVFNRLFTEEYKGTGIGLAIAKRVVDKHKGRIWVESIPEKGSVFYFRLKA